MLNKQISVTSFLLLVLVSNVSLSDSGEDSRIKPVDTVENSGKVVSPCYINGLEHDLVLSKEDVHDKKASNTCISLGGQLAPVTSDNFNNITSLLIQCKGPGSRAWIKSWQGIGYGSDCLAIYAGHGVPGGGIDVNCLGDSIPAVCAVTKGESYSAPGSDDEALEEEKKEEEKKEIEENKEGNKRNEEEEDEEINEDKYLVTMTDFNIHAASNIQPSISVTLSQESGTASIPVRNPRRQKLQKQA